MTSFEIEIQNESQVTKSQVAFLDEAENQGA